jgi:hypothetical protein
MLSLHSREHEIDAAGSDARKRKKLNDDFTPRFDMVLTGLEGEVRRDVGIREERPNLFR